MLDKIPEPDVVSWSSLISGYAQNGLANEALLAFAEMRFLGIQCNEFTFSSVLKACSASMDLKAGKQVHGIIVVKGFDSDVFVSNTLVVMYARCAELSDSRRLFGEILEPDIVSWNSLFSGYAQSGCYGDLVGLFGDMIMSGMQPDGVSLSSLVNACTGLRDGTLGRKMHGYLTKLGLHSNQFVANAVVDMYAKLGDLNSAVTAFEEINKPDTVSWNAIIAGCVLHGCHGWAFELLGQMRRLGINPDMFTLSTALKGCAGLRMKDLGKQLHSCLIKMHPKMDSFVTASLIDMYSKCGLTNNARVIYNLMTEHDLVVRNAMICGYSQNGEDVEVLCFFCEMYRNGIEFDDTTLSSVLKSAAKLQDVVVCAQVHALTMKSESQSNVILLNGLIDAYGKCGLVEDAAKIFKDCPIGDMVPFTSMITVYAQYGLAEKTFGLLREMQDVGLRMDEFVCSAILNAFANLSAYGPGKQVHSFILKLGFISDIFTSNSLVHMYAKCGNIDDAGRAFNEITKKGVVSWSAMIAGLAEHGNGKKAIEFFNEMVKDGVSPSPVTLLSVLSACSHSGLVTEGKIYFESMRELYDIEPVQEHYACMIDLLGRAGRLNEALELINSMPFGANASIWGALLSASRRHEDVELGKRAAKMLSTLERQDKGNDVLLGNIYASAGMWDDVAKLRVRMRDNMNKDPGMSWI